MNTQVEPTPLTTDDKCKSCYSFWLSAKELDRIGADPCTGCDQEKQNMFRPAEPRPLSSDYLFDADLTTKDRKTALGRIFMYDDEASRIQWRQEGEKG